MNILTSATALELLKSLDIDMQQPAAKELYSILYKNSLSANDKKSNLYATVKSFFNLNLKDTRSRISTIQHVADGRQFVAHAFMIVLFNSYRPELDSFPQTTAEDSINVLRLFNHPIRTLSIDPKVYANITAYPRFLKANDIKLKHNEVYFAETLINSKFITFVRKFIGDGLVTETLQSGIFKFSSVKSDIEILVAGINYDAEHLATVKGYTEQFIRDREGA